MTSRQEDVSVGPGVFKVLGTRQLKSSLKNSSVNDCSATSGSEGAHGRLPSSRISTPDQAQTLHFDTIVHEVQDLDENKDKLEKCFENLKCCLQQDYTAVEDALREQLYRSKDLEEQLNDFTELYQNEILNLKEELASMEEKIAYQSHERARDIQEVLEACQTRIFKMELQQQQQVVQLEGLENATGQPLVGKLINVLLVFMAVILVFVSTVANCVMPFMKTYNHTPSTLLFVILFSLLCWHWETISEYLKLPFLS
ncbi:transmembrane and coiled-coil domains protein 1-like [Centropristis striata]|uniref:transmembrane and coiled-coil domains protein 1-like n=1 Tax=Centropristis striata TaxID=184440 RepID=UPI0027E19968|nr:transmembrane and coiled-coil domains protein 1-like [Centropristis striata]